MTLLGRFFVFAMVFALAGCSGVRVLAPTPNIYAIEGYPEQTVPAALKTAQASIFYVTDRNRLPGETTEYGAERSSSMAFGVSKVSFGKASDWDQILAASSELDRKAELALNLVETREIMQFDPTPTPFDVVNGKPVRRPAAVKSYNANRAAFQAEIRKQMKLSNTPEVTIFIHGFNNTFEDATYSLADIWHFSGRNGVPILYSWPAGAGGPFGYFTDREAGEFTVFHLKEFLRQLAHIPELEKINIVAHSRGTDVTTTALRELIIEARGLQSSPLKTLKISNLILAAPDLDFSVVRQRLIAEGFGASIGQITVYMNQGDSALGLAQRLMTGQRLGTLTVDDLEDPEREIFAAVKTVSFVNVDGVKGLTGHNYFRTNRNVLSDIGLILRENAPAGSARRPLVRLEGNFWNMPESYPG